MLENNFSPLSTREAYRWVSRVGKTLGALRNAEAAHQRDPMTFSGRQELPDYLDSQASMFEQVRALAQQPELAHSRHGRLRDFLESFDDLRCSFTTVAEVLMPTPRQATAWSRTSALANQVARFGPGNADSAAGKSIGL